MKNTILAIFALVFLVSAAFCAVVSVKPPKKEVQQSLQKPVPTCKETIG
jgi:hypothetical protein